MTFNDNRVLSKFNFAKLSKFNRFTLDDNCVSFTITIQSKSGKFGSLFGKLNFDKTANDVMI